jgi:hypothetical protein
MADFMRIFAFDHAYSDLQMSLNDASAQDRCRSCNDDHDVVGECEDEFGEENNANDEP